mgnify:CR=1 FL=1
MINQLKSSNRLYEINTATYLRKLSDRYGRIITLSNIPDEELAHIAENGFGAIWLMGIWERSHIAIELALANEPLLNEARALLPDFQTRDIIGSAYSLKSYQVNEKFGGESELLTLRQRLSAHNLGLILDFVPNHTGFDHEWIVSQPDNYITGSHDQLVNHPEQYRDCNGYIIANGRDPNLGSWSDVAQLNAFAPSYRRASIDTLNHIATLCDGVRCDMAMLLTNQIFSNTWGDSAGPIPETEYWQEVISTVRETHEGFLFIAECYWNTVGLLLDQGFNYCYDKDFYDVLLAGSATQIIDYLSAITSILPHQVYFLENHDEPRAATVFPVDKHKAAAYLVNSLPGLFLIYNGQSVGYSAKIPVHFGREPDLLTDYDLAYYYELLLSKLPRQTLSWSLLPSNNQILVGSNDAGVNSLINYSDRPADIDITDLPIDPILLSAITGSGELQFHEDVLTLAPWQVIGVLP